MSLAARIQAAEADLETAKDALTEATKALEAAPDEEVLLDEVDALSERVEKMTQTVQALHRAEKALASRSRIIGDEGNAGEEGSAQKGSKSPAILNLKRLADPKVKGELIFKHATAEFLAFTERKSVQQVLAERYADDERVEATYRAAKAFMMKSAVTPADTYTSGWASQLVQTDVQGFIESVAELSVAAALAPRTMMLSFDNAGSITVPFENPLATTPTEPAWVGEGGAIPLVAGSLGSVTISPYKLAAISTTTNELARRSTPSIEAIIRNLLRKSYAKVLDQALLATSAPAVAGIRPASLLNGVSPLTAATGAADANIRADIFSLLSALSTAGIGMSPVLLVNKMDAVGVGMVANALGELPFRAEVAGGTIASIPFVASGHVPTGTVIMVDAEYLATAFGAVEFNVSDVAAITEANANGTAPTQADDGTTGAVGTAGQVPRDGGISLSENPATAALASTGFTSRSLWQTWSTGIRMVAETSWAKLNANAAQYITGADWK